MLILQYFSGRFLFLVEYDVVIVRKPTTLTLSHLVNMSHFI